ncbi:MAG: exo-alpha-sialidase, partial [Planctomycetes bacterium]|nr:exo-alpha-sialidase [Planctomycetota bacterium]
RSADGGKTWSPMRIIEDPGEKWSAANAATVVDRTNGRVWVLYLRCKPGRNTETSRPGTDDALTIARWSGDNGATWSDPIDLSKVARDYADPTWRVSVVGPGGAIQTRTGRLIAPIWKYPFGVFAMWSDDHGKTWQRGERVPGDIGGDEDQLVELSDGRILMDIRQEKGPHRWIATSADGGRTWSKPRPGETVTPCACAIERLTLEKSGAGRNRILWTGPKGPGRKTLVARLSCDEGATFGGERVISDEAAAYSDLTILKDGRAGVLWERGDYKFITFTTFDVEWLETAPR